MRKQTFAEASFEQYCKPIRREKFLGEMEEVMPWSELAAVIESTPKPEGVGRPSLGGERMLRIHFLQHWSTCPIQRWRRHCTTRGLCASFSGSISGGNRPLSEAERVRNRTKSKVRAKVEHVFLVIKQIFGWAKVRYRGLAKNTNWLFISYGLTNLYPARRGLMAGS